MTGLSDSFNRPINYLRISVTDRCNLRCIYCMPPEGIGLFGRGEMLSYEEVARVARAAAGLGINKVRLTGGEPLVRAGVVGLVAMLARIEGIDDLSLTTNGVLLGQHAAELKAAGLRRVNVSLDTLRPGRFGRIARRGRLRDVLAGIEAARRAGLEPVKTNTVVMRGINDDELLDFARLTIAEPWHIRFIELMPFNEAASHRRLMSAAEIKGRVEELGELEPQLQSGGGPARYFRFSGARGSIGFISPVSEHFCISCNRLRLTADGRLRPCLLSDEESDLRYPLRQGATTAELRKRIEEAVVLKPAGQRGGGRACSCGRAMVQIGG